MNRQADDIVRSLSQKKLGLYDRQDWPVSFFVAILYNKNSETANLRQGWGVYPRKGPFPQKLHFCISQNLTTIASQDAYLWYKFCKNLQISFLQNPANKWMS